MIVAEAILVGFCLIGVGLFSLSEASLVAASQTRLRSLLLRREAPHTEWEPAILDWQQSRRSLAALIIGINLCVLVASALTTHIVRTLAEKNNWGQFWRHWGVEIISLLMVAVILILFEITPKSYGVQNAERTVLRLSRFIKASSLLLRLPTAAIYAIAHALFFVLRINPHRARPAMTEKEIMALLEMGEEEGILEEEERALAHSILQLDKVLVREVMVPRPDIVALPADCSVQEALQTFIATGHSRLPLYEGSPHNIIGVLYAYDVLARFSEGEEDFVPREIARRPIFVPETKTLDSLLQDMRQRQMHIALVLDEHGEMRGLVTLEDILEEIVGELRDEHDRDVERVRHLDERTVIVDGRFNKHDFEEMFDFTFPDGEFDTVGGFVLHTLGRVPHKGEQVEAEGAEFIVEEIQGWRITKVKVIFR